MTLLHRQIPFHLRRDGRPAWIAFKPAERDHGELSVSCDQLCNAEVAYRRFVARKNQKGVHLKSDGVKSVSRQECSKFRRPVRHDPQPEDDAHSVICFSDLDEAQVEEVAMRFHELAEARGWQYKPDEIPVLEGRG